MLLEGKKKHIRNYILVHTKDGIISGIRCLSTKVTQQVV